MSMQSAGKIHQESSTRNRALGSGCVNSHTALSERKSGSTSQRRVKPKSKIIITKSQRYWAAYLFRQYGLPVPGWLRTSFKINQRRRKLLNDL